MARGTVNTGTDVVRTTLTNITNNYVLALSDANTMITATKATPMTITVPANSVVTGFVVGDCIEVVQYGVGTVTFVAGAGVTINSQYAYLTIDVQYGGAVLTKMDTDTWSLIGALS